MNKYEKEKMSVKIITVNTKSMPKTYKYCMSHLTYLGKNSIYDRFSDMNNNSGNLEKAEIIKSHEILRCGGCEVCNF